MTGLILVREQLMDLKETLLETCVSELKEVIIGKLGCPLSMVRNFIDSSGTAAELEMKENNNYNNVSDSDDGAMSDNRYALLHILNILVVILVFLSDLKRVTLVPEEGQEAGMVPSLSVFYPTPTELTAAMAAIQA